MRKNNKNKKVIEQARIYLKQIQNEKEQLEQQDKDKNLFYTSFIHEIKIPLSIIRNSLNVYLRKQQPKNNNNLTAIKINIENLNRDIVNLFDAEKICQRQLLYKHTTALNISKAIKKEIDAFKFNTINKKINLTLLSEGSLFVKINTYAFERIVKNLLDNAIKYTQEGGEINVSVTSDTSFIYLTVKDNGVGIPDNKLNKIFNAYYRVKKECHSQGLGIGLFLVKNIVGSVNGRIKVVSEPGKGSIFTIIFPKCLPTDDTGIADYVPSEPVGIANQELLKETYDKNKYTILIVEDSIALLIFLQEALINEYNVFYAKNGEEAIEKLQAMPKPDIIISDIMMDTMNGHEFFAHISANDNYNDIPFIFLTSRTIREEKLISLKKGIIDYIFKPFLIEELKAKIHSLLEKLNKVKETEIKKMEENIVKVIRKKGDNRFLEFERNCKQYALSPREKEVLRELLAGLQVKEIGAKLFLSTHTIRNHIRHIYEKCKVQNRVELMNLFRE